MNKYLLNGWIDNFYNNIEKQNYNPHFPEKKSEAQINALPKDRLLGGSRA